jgi:hypothetical protein
MSFAATGLAGLSMAEEISWDHAGMDRPEHHPPFRLRDRDVHARGLP